MQVYSGFQSALKLNISLKKNGRDGCETSRRCRDRSECIVRRTEAYMQKTEVLRYRVRGKSHSRGKSQSRATVLRSQIATAIRAIKRMQIGVNFIELSGQKFRATHEMWRWSKWAGDDGIRNERAKTIDILIEISLTGQHT